MTTINFPSSPSVNDTYTFNGRTWKFNGSGWEAVATTLTQIDAQTFTSSTTYTIPAGAQFILVECIGAGAGGDGSGYGGAGGGYWEQWVPVSALSSPVTVTIGAGGAGKNTAGGNRGGDCRFGTLYFPGAPGGGVGTNGYGGIGFDTSLLALGGSYIGGYSFGSGGPQYFSYNGNESFNEGADSYKGGGGGGANWYAGGKSYSTSLPVRVVDGLLVPTVGNGAAVGANGTGSDGGGGGSGTGNAGNGGTPGGGGGGALNPGTGGNGGNGQIKIWVYG